MDLTPLEDKQHSVRGRGFYVQYLQDSLLEYDRKNEYIFFTRKDGIPKVADVVHIPYFEPFFLTLPLFSGRPSVVTVHDLIPIIFLKHFPSGIKGRLIWEKQKASLKRVSAIITDSKTSKIDIVKHVGVREEKVHVVYLASDEQFHKIDISSETTSVDQLRKKYNLPSSFALYVGDVTWNKNVPRIVQACQHANVPLVMVGKAVSEKNFNRNNPWNIDRVRVEELVKDDKQIVLLGFVPTEDLVIIYNLATVFVMPSLYEGFGIPILEAMGCGCPVITSREGSLPEVAGDAAYYVDAYSVASITYAITTIYSNRKLRKELAQKSLLRAKIFSWANTARKTIALYEQAYKSS